MNIKWPRMAGFGPSAWNVDDHPWDVFAKPLHKPEDAPPALHSYPRPENRHDVSGRHDRKSR
jgi:hypothetical protein